nr:retrovirus-related Pol polyprotein from transposon TNT 1-94 [Tanacetum cinerariifolium]
MTYGVGPVLYPLVSPQHSPFLGHATQYISLFPAMERAGIKAHGLISLIVCAFSCELSIVLVSCHISTLCVRKYCVSELSSCAGSELGNELTSLAAGIKAHGLISLIVCAFSWGEENGIYILQLIDHGPFEPGTTRDTLSTTPEGGVLFGPEKPRTYDDLNDNEKKRFDVDVCATNIVLQGLPKDIYKLINHNIEAKVIWDNIKMLLAGSKLTKEDRESQMYDEFKRFKMLPGENINEYYVQFHKLVNDMRNIRMTMPNIQLNSKFVNNMSLEWDSSISSISTIITSSITTCPITFGNFAWGNGAVGNGEHRLELRMSMQVKGNQSSILTVMGLDISHGTALNRSVSRILTISKTRCC